MTKSLKTVMINEMNNISKHHDLYNVKPKPDIEQKFKNSKKYSKQQTALLTSPNQLIVGNAGAGSGKSHTIVGRLSYMAQCKYDLKHVLVLSFTRIAAENIKNRYPNSNSLTLDKYFTDIYYDNYHISNICFWKTVYNSLGILSHNFVPRPGMPKNVLNVIKKLKELMYKHYFKHITTQDEYLYQLLKLIKKNRNSIVSIINLTNESTLNLQQLILYTQLLQNPGSVTISKPLDHIKYIIVDESQDISTLHYILLLRLTADYRANLMLVGDATQSIFGFQGADSRYLNWLSSNKFPRFKTYPLSVNYRSNNSILAYDNQILGLISVNNKDFKLSNKKKQRVTLNHFKKHVKFNELPYSGNLAEQLPKCLKHNDTQTKNRIKWIAHEYKQGNQIAIMAFSHNQCLSMYEAIKKYIKDKFHKKPTSIDLTTKSVPPLTTISDILYHNDNIIKQVPVNSQYAKNLENEIDTLAERQLSISEHYNKNLPDDALNTIQSMTHQYFHSKKFKSMFKKYKLSPNFFMNMYHDLLQIEIRYNAANFKKQQLIYKKKHTADNQKYDFIISTIHGLKGLEFQDCLVIYNEPDTIFGTVTAQKERQYKQNKLRLYNVALSRAKNNEMIINAYNPSNDRKINGTQESVYQAPLANAYKKSISTISKNA